MSNEGLKGMQGLKPLTDFNSLSKEEQDFYITGNSHRISKTLPKYKHKKQYSIMYQNDLFRNRFNDEELFKSMSYEERKQYYENDVINEVWNNTYSDSKEFTDSEALGYIKSPRAKKYLIENEYIPSDKIVIDQFITEDTYIGGSKEFGAFQSGLKTAKAAIERYNKHKLEQAILMDKEDLLESTKETADQFKQYMSTNMFTNPEFTSQLNTEFNDLLSERMPTGEAIFPYYEAYKDSYQLDSNKLSSTKKADILSKYYAILEEAKTKSPEEQQEYIKKGIDIINDDIRHLVHENTTGADMVSNTLESIATKTVSSIAMTALGTRALYLALTDQEAFENYIQGKDENGEDLPSIRNLQYYADMDAFNSWGREDQQKARLNGGISTNVNLKDVGEDYAWLTPETMLESVAMMGYAGASIGLDYLMLGSGSLLKNIGRQTTKSLLKIGTNKAVLKGMHTFLNNPAFDFMGDFARMQLHSVSESTLEAVNVANEILEKGKADKQAFMNSPKVQDDINAYINSIRTSEMYAEKSMFSSYEDLYKEAYDAISSKYDEDIENAAATAFSVEASTKQLKNSIGDNIYKKYLYAKPLFKGKKVIDKDLIEETAEGVKRKAVTGIDRTKAIAKVIGGGFFDEFSDEMINKGALGVGQSLVNDYTQMTFANSDAYAAERLVNSIQAWASGAREAMFDPSSYQQGFVGAISPLTNHSINIKGIRDYFKLDADTKAKLSTSEVLNHFWYNPIVSEMADLDREYREDQELLDKYNKNKDKYQALLSDFTKSLKVINDLDISRTSKSSIDVVDAEENAAFQFIQHLESLGGLEETIPLVGEYFNKLKNAAKGNVTNEDISAYLNTAENATAFSKLKTEEAKQKAREEAKQVIQNNATKLLETIDAYQKNISFIDTYLGDVITEEAKKSIAFNMHKKDSWKKRLTELESKISGNSKPTTNISFGKRTHAGILDDIEVYSKNIENIKTLLSDDKTDKLTKKKLKSKLVEFERLKKQSEEALENGDNILTAEEIISAHPEVRHRMLVTPNRYTREQQDEIERAERILIEKDPNYKEIIRDIASLSNRVTIAEDAYSAALQNPKEFVSYIQKTTSEQKASYINSRAKIVEDWIAKDLESKFEIMTEDKFSDYVNSVLNNYSSKSITNLIKKAPFITGYLNKAINKKRLLEESFNIVDTLDLEEDGKKAIKESLKNLANSVKTAEEFHSLIEGAIDDKSVSDQNKVILNEILENLIEVGHQRNATVIQTREERLKKEKEAREKAEKETKEKAFKEDGKNFGFDGYKVKDTIFFVKNGKKGTIVGFENGVMSIKLEKEKVVRRIKNVSDISKNPIKKEESKVKEGSFVETGKVDLGLEQNKEENKKPEESKKPEKPEVKKTNSIELNFIPNSEEIEEQEILKRNEHPEILLGNVLYEYDSSELQGIANLQRKAVRKEAKTPTLEAFYNFIDTLGIKYQEIIDTVVPEVFAKFPNTEVHFLLTRPKHAEVAKDPMQDIVVNVIEFTPEIEKIYKSKGENLGGVLVSNGKSWLVIGTTGYAQPKNGDQSQWNNYITLKDRLKAKRKKFLDSNKEESYFVSDEFTNIKHVDNGRITHILPGQETTKFRKVSKLLSSKESNPNGYNFGNLIFGIQQGDKFTLIGAEDTNALPPNNTEFNKGAVFIMVKSGSGKLIPIKLKTTTMSDIDTSSDLYGIITQTVTRLNDTNFNERKAALDILRTLIVTSQENKNIVVGNETDNTISIYSEGVKLYEFTPGKVETSELLKAFLDTDFRINLTKSVLEDSATLEMYDEAGAIQTDVARLGTVNMSYAIYPLNKEGNIIKTEESGVIITTTKSKSEFIEASRFSVKISGTLYRETSPGVWENELHQKVVNQDTIDQLNLHKKIEEQGIKSNKVNNKTYYILDRDSENPIVANKISKNRIHIVSKEEALGVISTVTKREEKEAKQAKAKEKLQEVENIEMLSEETVDLGDALEEGGNNPTLDVLSIEEVLLETPSRPKQKPKEVKPAEPTKKIINQKNDPNTVGEGALEDLTKPKEIITFADVIRTRENRIELLGIFKSKGWETPTTNGEMEQILKSKNISTDNITDVKTWLQIIKDCR